MRTRHRPLRKEVSVCARTCKRGARLAAPQAGKPLVGLEVGIAQAGGASRGGGQSSGGATPSASWDATELTEVAWMGAGNGGFRSCHIAAIRGASRGYRLSEIVSRRFARQSAHSQQRKLRQATDSGECEEQVSMCACGKHGVGRLMSALRAGQCVPRLLESASGLCLGVACQSALAAAAQAAASSVSSQLNAF